MKGSEIKAEHIKSLEWAVLFSRKDLKSLREGDWLNLKEDLYDFIAAPTPLQTSFLPPSTKEEFIRTVTPAKVSQIQERIKSDLFKYSYTPNDPSGEPIIRAKAVEFNFVSFGPDIPFYQLIQELDATTSARLALGFHLVGARVTQSNIRNCPECRSVFLIKRKPRNDRTFHCSLRCSRNAATRRYREKNKKELRAKEQERSHRRYREKQRRKLGLGTKVERRPRKAKNA